MSAETWPPIVGVSLIAVGWGAYYGRAMVGGWLAKRRFLRDAAAALRRPQQPSRARADLDIVSMLSDDQRAVLLRLASKRDPVEFEELRSAISHGAFLSRAIEALAGLIETGTDERSRLFVRLTPRGERIAFLIKYETEATE